VVHSIAASLTGEKILCGDLENAVTAGTCSIVFFAGDGFQQRAVSLHQSNRANRIGVKALQRAGIYEYVDRRAFGVDIGQNRPSSFGTVP